MSKYAASVRVTLTLSVDSADIQPLIDLIADRFPDVYPIAGAHAEPKPVPDVSGLDRFAVRLTDNASSLSDSLTDLNTDTDAKPERNYFLVDPA
jgi:hypothetical protein